MLDTSSPPISRLDNWPAMALADGWIEERGSLQQLQAERCGWAAAAAAGGSAWLRP